MRCRSGATTVAFPREGKRCGNCSDSQKRGRTIDFGYAGRLGRSGRTTRTTPRPPPPQRLGHRRRRRQGQSHCSSKCRLQRIHAVAPQIPFLLSLKSHNRTHENKRKIQSATIWPRLTTQGRINRGLRLSLFPDRTRTAGRPFRRPARFCGRPFVTGDVIRAFRRIRAQPRAAPRTAARPARRWPEPSPPRPPPWSAHASGAPACAGCVPRGRQACP